jgi:hypothetical protein
MRPLELHMACSVIQRSKGRSSVAAAAYIAGEKLTDQRTGLEHNYSRRDGVVLTGIALSEQAPAWALDRQKLWSSAEIREAHPRAQTARSMTVNLPHEFSGEHRREAVAKIAHLLADRYRGGVDWALHEPSKDGDHRNHHGHFLMTARPFENGQWAAKKDRTLDDRYGKGPEEYKILRERISGVINDIAVREKLPVYVEYLSFADRQLELEPTKKLGPGASAKERRGERTERGDDNRAIRARNEEREALRVQSNVINIEAARELQKHRRGTPLPRNWQAAYADMYRDSHNKRAAMNEHLEREHGERERRAREDAAQLQQSIDRANFVQRLWRHVSGQMRRDRESIEAAKAELRVIGQRKEEAVARFERERKERFEAFHNERLLYEQRIREQLDLAVGDEARRPSTDHFSRTRPDRPAMEERLLRPRPSPAPAELRHKPAMPPPANEQTDVLSRRDAFFKRVQETRLPAETAPERPAKALEGTPRPADGADPQKSAKPDYAARTAAFFEKARRKAKPETDSPAPLDSPAPDQVSERANRLKRLRKSALERETAPEKAVEKPKANPLPTHHPAPETRPRPDYSARTAAFIARTRRQRPPEPAKEPITVKPPHVANDDGRAAFMKRFGQDIHGPEIEPDQAGPEL